MEVLKYNDVILRPSDIDVLENPCFLNDQVIAFYFSYLSSLCSEDDIAFVPPVVSFWLANCDVKSRKDAVEPLKLGSKRLVLFTVNNNEDLDKGEGGTHWSILIFDRTKNSFLHLDTLKGVNHAHAFKLYDSVKQYVGVPSASIKERVKNKNKNKKKSKAASVAATEWPRLFLIFIFVTNLSKRGTGCPSLQEMLMILLSWGPLDKRSGDSLKIYETATDDMFGCMLRNGKETLPYVEQNGFTYFLEWLGGSVSIGGALPKYDGGFVKVVRNALYDEWGMMLLKHHIEVFGFKNWEDVTVYAITEAGLKELVSDNDAWELVGVKNLPSVIEIWVVTARGTRDIAGEQTADEYGDDEEDDSETDADEEFEETDDEVDDFLFDSNVDNTLEFGGVGNQGCTWKYYNKMMNSTRLAKRWKGEMKFHSNWKVKDFQKHVQTHEKCHLSYKQAWRALKVAYEDDHGLAEEEYRYGGGKFGGTMLVANGVDSNENIFPLAYAIVEGENKESWTWFLDLLTLDLELNDYKEPTFTFMSDKQKGLLPAFEDVIPRAMHKFCVRHLEGNFKNAGYSGEALKDLLWEAAKATTVSQYEEVMRKIKDEDVAAYDWLVGKQASEWSRSHFHIAPKSDILTKNICESYNRVLKEARSQTLIRCLENIREMLMKRFFDLREKAENWKGLLCPTVASKVAINSKLAGGYTAIQSDISLFEVKGYRAKNWEQHAVDLVERSCTCNVWQLTGIPCAHAICAIWIQRQQYRKEVEEYVDEYYFVQTYKEAAAKQKKSQRKLLKRRMLKAARKPGQEEAASNSIFETEISVQETTEPWWADLPVEPDICSENFIFIPTPTTQDNENQDGNNGMCFIPTPTAAPSAAGPNPPRETVVQSPITQVSAAPSSSKRHKREVVSPRRKPYLTRSSLKTRFRNTPNDPLVVD
ncbi:unnamed protein product [Cuscuta campestris]|uniref:SWIM-type domain-containing protein n=1 Tax=Cuscuta campestris TaxID=132261 RepID=A0A484L311_9ASTE|nr:unnamed protein product [Cuscuta campestris]